MRAGRKNKAVTPDEMRCFDLLAQEYFGIPSLLLMENAGRAAAETALGMLRGKNKRVVVVCGSGNNGGDGFVCARHLLNKGVKVEVFLVGKIVSERPSPVSDAGINLRVLGSLKCPLRVFNGRKLKTVLDKSSLVIDAIFGIGFRGEPRDPCSEAIRMINDSGKKILSLDVPSGLNALNGEAPGNCVKADVTVTFGFPKTGLYLGKGPHLSGRVVVADISLPPARSLKSLNKHAKAI